MPGTEPHADDLLASLATRVRVLEAREAITQQYFNYAWFLDSKEWHRVAEGIFSDDAELNLGTGMATHRGRDEIGAAFDDMLPDFAGTAHYFTNVVVTLTEGGTASSRAYFQSFHWTKEMAEGKDRPPVDFVGAGVYLDEWRETPEGWRITKRRRRNLGPGPLGFGSPPPSFNAKMKGWGGGKEE